MLLFHKRINQTNSTYIAVKVFVLCILRRLRKIHTFLNHILQPASCVSACVMTQCEHTAQDDEVKCGSLVVEQPRQQDSAVKETRVRRSRVGDGESKGGQQREPTDSKISWSSSLICVT